MGPCTLGTPHGTVDRSVTGPRGRPAHRLRTLAGRFKRSELGGLAGDSGYMAVTQGSYVGSDLVQIAIITHALGLAEFGRFALVVAFVSLVSAVLNVKVSIAATTFGARHLREDPRSAAGVFQLAYLVDLSTGAVFVLAVGLLSLLIGTGIVDGVGLVVVLLYTLVPLAKNLDNTPLVILRLRDRFKLVATVTFATEMLRLACVVAALAVDKSLLAVVIGLVVGRFVASAAKAVLAYWVFEKDFPDVRLARPAIRHLPPDERQAMRRTIVKSSAISLDHITQVHVPTLLLGAYVGATGTGLYKIGMALAAVVSKVADPASAALLPRLSRLWSEERFDDLRRLVKQATLITLPIIAVVFMLIVVLRDPLLQVLGGGPEATEAGTILILGAAGQAMYAAVFWRGTVLHAARRTGAVAAVSMIGAALQIAASFVMIRAWGAEGAALAFLLSRLFINGSLSVLAVRVMNRAGRGPDPPLARPQVEA